ncbi:hypothetical protein ASF53_24085 [Methylobacterium sp. Leaf123]|uniref:putative bifunctional diguanylate cyclase/phosphodiesterase n=1 Tax=Methylobacterium sp. Leaf123 TaxID=1736264 RepID=UPI000701328D|nr:EAL domain-containing protein [Methylobacterium sp. Leaf123]KQQ19142.1 hypothetical protein ASF53_24085 [Methylobacterium sp. Leaf123]
MQVAQFRAITKEAPLFYATLWLTLAYLAYVFWPTTPVWLVLPPILFVTPVCCLRSLHYWRIQDAPIEADEAARRLQKMTVVIRLTMMLSSAWVLMLAQYGDDLQHVHILCFVILQSLFCTLGLLHIPKTALQVQACFVPVVFYLLLFGSGALIFATIAYLVLAMVAGFLTLMYSDIFMSRILQHHRLEQLNNENLRLANTDILTGLPNRRNFFDELTKAFDARNAGEDMLHLAFIDLDGFKPVNDTYGHPTGDAVLTEVGRRLAAFSSRGDPARLGGDEFGLLFRGTKENALAFVEDVCASLKRPYAIAGGIVHLGATAGLASADDAQGRAALLIEIADYALYKGKAKGRGTVVHFDGALEKALHRRGLIEQALRGGNLENELFLNFQPVIALETRRAVGFEALARWNNPILGAVPPSEFIAAAEACEMVSHLTKILFRKALAVASTWPSHLSLSFNLSAHDVVRPEMANALAAIIMESGVNPRRVILELTETALIRDFSKAQTTLEALKPLGVSFALDDFGTGYSSLSYVHKLPIDRLKIDRSFVADIEQNESGRKVICSVIGLAASLNLQCVVEGVETLEQVALLNELGCELVQGYWFGKPLVEQDVLPWLATVGAPGQASALTLQPAHSLEIPARCFEESPSPALRDEAFT